MIIDGLTTGSLFSFLWNMLVSISFQFVGFLLTYLLHTTHAAKLGSRAGLGVTLIQYGFAMRGRQDDWVDGGRGDQLQSDGWGWKKPSSPMPTFDTAAEAEEYYRNHNLVASFTLGCLFARVSFLNPCTRPVRSSPGIPVQTRPRPHRAHDIRSLFPARHRLLLLVIRPSHYRHHGRHEC